ncbi:MAG: thioredoxin family protein [Deltaproteobacteria bacterium]|nr:thioredoxin family protein [Deltaproteobacteria bacterium]
MIEEITDDTFVQQTAQGLCLVLFYKDPCPYCKTMKGVVEKFGARNSGVKLLQINGLENSKSAGELGIEGFPFLLFYKDGQPTSARQKGLTNPQGLNTLLENLG